MVDNHIQCTLQKDNTIQVSWLPEEYAYCGNKVNLRERGDPWDKGWTITQVGTCMPTEYVLKHKDNYKTQREASDI